MPVNTLATRCWPGRLTRRLTLAEHLVASLSDDVCHALALTWSLFLTPTVVPSSLNQVALGLAIPLSRRYRTLMTPGIQCFSAYSPTLAYAGQVEVWQWLVAELKVSAEDQVDLAREALPKAVRASDNHQMVHHLVDLLQHDTHFSDEVLDEACLHPHADYLEMMHRAKPKAMERWVKRSGPPPGEVGVKVFEWRRQFPMREADNYWWAHPRYVSRLTPWLKLAMADAGVKPLPMGAHALPWYKLRRYRHFHPTFPDHFLTVNDIMTLRCQINHWALLPTDLIAQFDEKELLTTSGLHEEGRWYTGNLNTLSPDLLQRVVDRWAPTLLEVKTAHSVTTWEWLAQAAAVRGLTCISGDFKGLEPALDFNALKPNRFTVHVARQLVHAEQKMLHTDVAQYLIRHSDLLGLPRGESAFPPGVLVISAYSPAESDNLDETARQVKTVTSNKRRRGL